MSKKRKKRLVRIDAIDVYPLTHERMVHFKYNVGTIPYRGNVLVGLTEDPWPKIAKYFDSEHTLLLQQEREV